MTTKKLQFIGCWLLIFCVISPATAIVHGKPRKWWINLGFGVGGSKIATGPAGEVSANLRVYKHFLIVARSSGVTDNTNAFTKSFACIYSGGTRCRIDNDNVGDLAGLIGYMWQGSSGYSAFSAGVGYVSGQQEHDNDRLDHFHTVGFPVELQTFWTPTGHFGLGLIAFGDLNSKHSFGGIVFAVQIGDHYHSPPFGGY